MRLSSENLLEIQCFVYFLFKGTCHPVLIQHDCEYITHLVREPEHLENVFRLFTVDLRQPKPGSHAAFRAHEYLIARYVNKDLVLPQQLLATLPREQPDDVYSHFFRMAQHFIHNTFPNPIQLPNYLLNIEGVGTDAVPPFAVWTNVVNAPAPDDATAYARALRRANDQARAMWDRDFFPQEPFTAWELEQEIY